MKSLQTFKNELFEVGAKIEGETILFDVEHVAKCLGITDVKNGVPYVRWSRVNSYLPKDSPQVAKGDLIPEPMVYKLAFKASNEVAEQFQDWLAIEVIPSIRKKGQYVLASNNVIEFEKQLVGVKYTSEILRVDEPSKIKMLEAAHNQHGVPTNHLPVYVENEELKKPISELLKEYNVGISAIKANKILLTVGILEIKHRPSSKGGKKEFKSVTEKGKYYGLNAISPQNPKETQPLYYPSKFGELIPILTGQGVS